MQEIEYWIGFNLIKGIGSVRFRAILDFFGDLSIAWNSPRSALLSVPLSEKIVDKILETRKSDRLKQVLELIQRENIQVLTWNDDDYPSQLKEIDQPPPVLYVKGKILPEDDWSIAVVGTRQVTAYGKRVASDLVTYLAHQNITVVSGLARGVDGVAHDSTLRSGGRTLAVLGCGVDQVYPPEHRGLTERIINNGAILSDYPPGTPPEGINFPPRNRIISGLSRAVVVVEAGKTSGALITSTFAAEQGREVFAIPGSIYAPQSIGTNRLIQQGAHPLLDYSEVLENLNLKNMAEKTYLRQNFPVEGIEKQVLQTISSEPIHIDEIQEQTGLPIEQVSATLIMLELKGIIYQTNGMNYVSIREIDE